MHCITRRPCLSPLRLLACSLQGYGGCADGLPSPHGSGGGRPLPPGRLLLYTNAHVWAGDVAAAGAPTAEALLVDPATRRFVYVGSASGARAAAASREAEVEVTDLGGAHVIPGLVDAHLHLISGGLALSRLSLAAAASRREFVGAVAAGAAALGPGQWLQGGGWDENRWGGEAPSAAWIDAGAPGRQAATLWASHLCHAFVCPAGPPPLLLLPCLLPAAPRPPGERRRPACLARLQPRAPRLPGCCATMPTWGLPTQRHCAWRASPPPQPTRRGAPSCGEPTGSPPACSQMRPCSWLRVRGLGGAAAALSGVL